VAIDTAIPLGLIAHELTSNALKYAFPEERRGELRVALEKNGSSVQLVVADNGVGIPDHVRWDRPETLGLQLVESLTRQLKGSVELRREETGTCVAVSIPDQLFDVGG
jgi:two-component sensor histidine kinase